MVARARTLATLVQLSQGPKHPQLEETIYTSSRSCHGFLPGSQWKSTSFLSDNLRQVAALFTAADGLAADRQPPVGMFSK